MPFIKEDKAISGGQIQKGGLKTIQKLKTVKIQETIQKQEKIIIPKSLLKPVLRYEAMQMERPMSAQKLLYESHPFKGLGKIYETQKLQVSAVILGFVPLHAQAQKDKHIHLLKQMSKQEKKQLQVPEFASMSLSIPKYDYTFKVPSITIYKPPKIHTLIPLFKSNERIDKKDPRKKLGLLDDELLFTKKKLKMPTDLTLGYREREWKMPKIESMLKM